MSQKHNPKEITKQIQTVFWVALLFPVLMLTLFHFLVTVYHVGLSTEYASYMFSLFIIVIISSFIVIPTTLITSRNRIKRIEKTIPLDAKLTEYRDAFFWHLYGVEFCLLLSAVYYLLDANVQILLLSGSLLILLITMAPTKDKIANDLGLNQKERFEI